MLYEIMRKNTAIAIADFSETGRMLWYSKDKVNKELAPFWENESADFLVRWWEERSIPIGQNKIQELLSSKGLISTGEYLLKNLGLSLTDYYWIRPMGESYKWEDVNLFTNGFTNEVELEQINIDDTANKYSKYVPNSSLQGQLDKKWIIHDGKRYLIKGNRNEFSTESINEVIATELHKAQRYDNYTPYELVKIKGKEYDFGCMSECFTSEKLELISAYGVVTSEKAQNDVSSYEHFIHVCGKYGMDTELLRMDLEYQIQMDFILSGRDRHLSNVSVLRDAETLQFVRMAPIYDSGKCLFIGETVPNSTKDILSVQTTSFAGNELKLMDYVKDRSLVDVTKLPDSSLIEKMYEKDSQMDESRIKRMKEVYEKKIDLYRKFQLGQNLKVLKLNK